MKAGRSKSVEVGSSRRQAEIESARQELDAGAERLRALCERLAPLPEGARRPIEVKLRLAAATLRHALSEVDETLRHLSHALALESFQEIPAELEMAAALPAEPPARKREGKKRKSAAGPAETAPSAEMVQSLTLEHAMEHLAELPGAGEEQPEEEQPEEEQPEEEAPAARKRSRRRGGRKKRSSEGAEAPAGEAVEPAETPPATPTGSGPEAGGAEGAEPDAPAPGARKRSRRRGSRRKSGRGAAKESDPAA